MHKSTAGSLRQQVGMIRQFARRHLDISDLVTEAAAAVYMLVIINGYVALSQLNTQYYYIVALDIVASIGWGIIDGFTYSLGSSVDRGRQTEMVKKAQESPTSEKSFKEIMRELEDTFISSFSEDTKKNIT